MADPVIDAAQRALAGHARRDKSRQEAMEAAAREALQPVREMHRPYATNDPRSPYGVVCNHCLGPKQWPCPTARLVYSDEELSR